MRTILKLLASGAFGVSRSWYVTPTGAGAGDGTSLANAWNDWASVNFTVVEPGDTIYWSGTFTTSFTVAKSGLAGRPIYIKSLIAAPGTIDGGGAIQRGIYINGYNYIELDGGTIQETTLDGVGVYNAVGIVVRNITATAITGVGAQAFQNEGAVQATYYNCTGTNCTDDGMSLHDNAQVTAYDCTFTGNAQGVNAINTAVFVGWRCTISGNTTASVQPDTNSDFTFYDSFITGTFIANSSVALKLIRCRLTDITAGIVNASCLLTMTHCRMVGNSRIEIRSAGNTMERCLFESTTTRMVNTTNSGDIDINYSVFKLSTAIFAVRGNSTGQIRLNNCSIVGAANVGNAVEGFGTNVAGAVELTNCILYDLNNAYTTDADGIIFADYVNRNDITLVTSGSGPITQTNTITTDPQFVDIAGYNFATGSNTKNVGTSTGITTGIASASWGDANTTPVVTTAEQSGTYDLGAYI